MCHLPRIHHQSERQGLLPLQKMMWSWSKIKPQNRRNRRLWTMLEKRRAVAERLWFSYGNVSSRQAGNETLILLGSHPKDSLKSRLISLIDGTERVICDLPSRAQCSVVELNGLLRLFKHQNTPKKLQNYRNESSEPHKWFESQIKSDSEWGSLYREVLVSLDLQEQGSPVDDCGLTSYRIDIHDFPFQYI